MNPTELKDFRNSLGLSQQQFAQLVGALSRRSVRRWEVEGVPRHVELMVVLAKEVPGVRPWLMRRLKNTGGQQ
jgi:DNA-binding transcriptional regulator YiaG